MIPLSLTLLLLLPQSPAMPDAPWPHAADSLPLGDRIEPPAGFQRVSLGPGSFGAFLRVLPVKTGHPPVRLFDGSLKSRQDVHAAVLDLDIGKRNLQQCADAVIRLRAEYLWSMDLQSRIMFHFTSGDEASWPRWAQGWRPAIEGNRVQWSRTAAPDSSYRSFRAYLDKLFEFAGTRSLRKELGPLKPEEAPAPGDVLVQAGSPGHAVILADAAERPGTGERLYLLAQSYMPAQEIHVLNNPAEPALGPWFRMPEAGTVATPEWTFRRDDLRRFPD